MVILGAICLRFVEAVKLKEQELRTAAMAEAAVAQRRWEMNLCDKNPIDLLDKCLEWNVIRSSRGSQSSWVVAMLKISANLITTFMDQLGWKYCVFLFCFVYVAVLSQRAKTKSGS